PTKYAHFLTSWDSVDPNSQTLELLTSRLLKEESRITVIDEVPKAFSAMSISSDKNQQNYQQSSSNKPRKVKCYYCKKLGHTKNECFKLKRKQAVPQRQSAVQSKYENNSAQLFLVEAPVFSGLKEDVWLADSGASNHMCHNRRLFLNYKLLDHPKTVRLGDSKSIPVLEIGRASCRERLNVEVKAVVC